MVIRTSDHEYPVIGVKETTEQYDMYICRDVSSKCLCRIMSIKDSGLFPDLVGYLTDAVNRDAFTDYREHFIDNGRLCIVMRYEQGVTLSTKLATESIPFPERLELGRRILEKAVLQDIPDYFMAKCFTPDQMIIAPDLTVNFNYPIEDIISNRDQNGRSNIISVLRLLFADELERKVPDLLMDFFKRLPELTEQRLLDIYSEYYTVAGQLEDYDVKDEQPKTFWFKLWDKIKALLKFLKNILIIALIIAALAYLIYTIIDPGKNNDNNGHFEYIGTVKILRENESQPATEKPTAAPTAAPTASATVPPTEAGTAADSTSATAPTAAPAPTAAATTAPTAAASTTPTVNTTE